MLLLWFKSKIKFHKNLFENIKLVYSLFLNFYYNSKCNITNITIMKPFSVISYICVNDGYIILIIKLVVFIFIVFDRI
jgi:hypothetical protein